MNQNVDNSPLKPLKYPGLGLFMSFKIVFELILYIFKCAWRGFLFVFKDIPIYAWQKMSGKVDEAYKGTKKIAEKSKNNQTPAKKSVLNMDLNDLLKNTKMMKRKMENLEKEKAKLINSQQGVQKRISDIDIKIKGYKTLKKNYEKLESKFNNYVNPIEEKKDNG